jgi:hypothetical protein
VAWVRNEEEKMAILRNVKYAIFVSILSLLFVASGWGQSVNGSISGTVSDPTGAVIPGAELTLTATGTGAVARFTSGQDGLYSFSNLVEGNYELRVAAKGFKDYLQTGIVVHLSQLIRQDVIMQLGSTVQTVEVNANASPLNYQTPEVKGQVARQEIVDLPLELVGAQRNAATFVTLVAGVSPNTPGDELWASRFNGGQAMTDEGIMDGVSMVEGVMSQSGMVSLQAWPIPPEGVGEVSVLNSNYDVQYGSSSAAVITVSTREGTGEFHGGTFEFLRNTDLNSRQFGIATRPENIQNDFGGFIGGPLKFVPKFWSNKKKSYFFLEFEGYRSVGAATKPILTVPTVQEREGNFSDWPNPIYDPNTTQTVVVNGQTTYTRQQFMGCNGTTPNVICPSDPRLASSLAPAWLKYVPPPNLPGLTANYESPFALADSLVANTDGWSIRGDQYYGDKDHISVTDHYNGSLATHIRAFPAVIDTNSTRIPNYEDSPRLNWDHTLKPNLLNHFAFGFLDLPTGQRNSSDCCVNELPKIPGVYAYTQTPVINFSEYSSYGNNGDFYQRRPTYIWNDMITWVRGKHTLHFGGEYRRLAEINEFPSNDSGTFGFTDLNTGLLNIPSGNAYASFLMGYVSNANATFYTLDSFRPRGDAWSLFTGDNWKATPKLTVTLGVRWDVNRADVEIQDRTSFFDPVGLNPGAGNLPGRLAFGGTKWGAASFGRRSPEENFFKGVGPRIGLAYTLTPKTVIRAGYGIFYEQAFYPGWNGGIGTDGFNATPSFSSSLGGLQPAFLLQNGFPQNFVHPPVISSSFDNGQNAPNYRPFDANRLPYTSQWDLVIEHQFTPDFYINVMYLGNKGTRLLDDTAPPNVLNPSLLSMGSKLYDTFAPGQTTLDGVAAPYAAWQQQMVACPPTVAQALLPFPQYCGNIYPLNENAGNSTYHSLQIKAEKRVSHGVWVLANYTWSKDITDTDTVQTSTEGGVSSGIFSPYERRRNKGVAASDIPQFMSLSATYDLPFGAGKRFLNEGGIVNGVLGGWEAATIFHANAGYPLWFRSSSCNIPGEFAESCIPGIISGANPFAQNPGSFDPGKGPLLNKAAFESPTDFNFYQGNGTRITNMRIFPYHNQDFVMTKQIRFTEKVGMQFRAEAFNLWNWHFFTPPGSSGTGAESVNSDVASPSFGVWNGSVSYPRVFQFGLKLLF